MRCEQCGKGDLTWKYTGSSMMGVAASENESGTTRIHDPNYYCFDAICPDGHITKMVFYRADRMKD